MPAIWADAGLNCVGGAWDQADITVAFVTVSRDMADRQTSPAYSPCARVWLHTGVITGQFRNQSESWLRTCITRFRLFSRAERQLRNSGR